MPEDLESLLFEAGAQQPSQPPVVHASPGERHLIDSGGRARAGGDSDERLRDAGMKFRRYLPCRRCPSEVVDDRMPKPLQLEGRSSIESAAFMQLRHVVLATYSVRFIDSDAFELNRGLRLVINKAALQDQSSRSIKKA